MVKKNRGSFFRFWQDGAAGVSATIGFVSRSEGGWQRDFHLPQKKKKSFMIEKRKDGRKEGKRWDRMRGLGQKLWVIIY